MNDLIERVKRHAGASWMPMATRIVLREAADALAALQAELTRTKTLLRVEQAALASFIKEQLEHDDE